MIDSGIYLIVAAGIVLLAYIKFIIFPKKILEAKIEEREKNILVVEKKNDPVYQNDFYGTDKLINDPSGFVKKAIDLKEKLTKGEEISVDAVQAFYLIRNVEHHNLIVGETGTINFKTLEESATFDDDKMVELQQRIIEFEKDDANNRVYFQIPEYVQEVLPLKDGGVRWVFKEEHANWCGIKSQCFDKYDRAMPDPDVVLDVDKNKNRERPKENSGQNDQTKDLSRKLTRMIEMEEERRVDEMLRNKKVENTESSDQEHIQSSILVSSEYLDEVEELASEFQIPDFESSFDDEEQSLEVETESCAGIDNFDALSEDNLKEDNLKEDNLKLINYNNMEEFCMLLAHERKYLVSIFAELFSNKPDGNIFIDFDDSKILIEKNYFVKHLRNFIEKDSVNSFNKDLLAKGAIDIFDGNKVNSIINAIDVDSKFDRFGRGNSQALWNMLFKVVDVDDIFFSGWFIKFHIDSFDGVENFIAKFARGSSVEIISALPKEIKHQIKLIKNVKVFY